MVLNIPLEEVIALIGRDCSQHFDDLDTGKLGISSNEIALALFRRRICAYEWYPSIAYDPSHMQRTHGEHLYRMTLQDVQTHLSRGGTAIMGVKSRSGNWGHWIVWHADEVFDPNPNRALAFKAGERIEMQNAIIIVQ